MVILGLEKPVEYGGNKIFDPTMAQMVLNALNNYILAMKQDYEQGREDLKEFNKNFGDFFSPILKDMEWYDLNVTGATRDLVNDLYSRGLDLRSPEFRSAISRWVNNMPVGKINQLKLSAAGANEYLKNKAALEAAGKYNPDFEENFLGYNLRDYSTLTSGIWNRMSPAEIKSLKELTESSYNNRTAHDLTKDEVLSFDGQTYDPRMRYKGFTDADLLNIANTIAPGLTGTPWFDYYRDLARRQLIASGKDITDENVTAQLARNIADTNLEFLIRPVGDLWDWYQQQQLQISREKLQMARNAAKRQREEEEEKRKGWTYRLQLESYLRKKANGGTRESFEKWLKNNTGTMEVSSDMARNYSAYYKSGQAIINETGDQLSAKAFFAGLSNPEKQTPLDVKRSTVYFTDNSLNTTRVREYAYAGRNLTRGSISQKFNDWLKRNHVLGFSTGGDISVNHTYTGGSDFYDLNGVVRVRRQDLDRYFLGWNKDSEKMSKMAQLGLTVILNDGTVANPDNVKKEINYSEINYIDIPATRTMEANNLEMNRQIDAYSDALNFGKNKGAKWLNTYFNLDEDNDE